MAEMIISYRLYPEQVTDIVEDFFVKCSEKRKGESVTLSEKAILRMINRPQRNDFGTSQRIELNLQGLRDAIYSIKLPSGRFSTFIFEGEGDVTFTVQNEEYIGEGIDKLFRIKKPKDKKKR